DFPGGARPADEQALPSGQRGRERGHEAGSRRWSLVELRSSVHLRLVEEILHAGGGAVTRTRHGACSSTYLTVFPKENLGLPSRRLRGARSTRISACVCKATWTIALPAERAGIVTASTSTP